MENASRIRRDAAGHKHVAELRNGGVGKNLLDVGLRNANGGSEDGGQRSDHCDYEQCGRRFIKNRVRARDHVNAGRHHGSGVNQRGDRSWAFHGVG